MGNLVKRSILVSSVWALAWAAPAFAQDTGANTSGSWENAAIWTLGSVPNSSNNVYIGSVYPPGAVGTATVTLAASESADNVKVGYGPATGTLNLGANTLTITGGLFLGQFGGNGTLSEAAGGSFTAPSVTILNANSLTFGTADATGAIDIEDGSTLTTTATGNITVGGAIANGATLNLGAQATLSGGLNIEGTGATLNLAGNNLTASTLSLGYYLTSPVNFTRGTGTPGTLTVGTLQLANSQPLALIAGDAVTNIDVESGATLTTAATGNITGGGAIANGSTLNLGAKTTLSGGLNIEGTGATLNLAGNNLTASTLSLGYYLTSPVNFDRGTGTPGTLTVGTLQLANSQPLALIAGDAVTNIDVESGSTLTTAATGNITGGGAIANGSTLNLGAKTTLSGSLNIEGTGATLNLAGNNLTASTLSLGYYLTSPVNFDRGTGTPGTLTVGTLDLGNSQPLALIAGDAVTNIDVESGSTLTTVATGNITGGGAIANGSTLNLGAKTTLSGSLNIEGTGATLNLAGHNLAASSLSLGYYLTSPVNFTRGTGTPGTLTLSSLSLGNSQALTLIAADVINGANTTPINLYGGSSLTTAATANIVSSTVNVVNSTLNLGANLSIGNQTVNVESAGATVNLFGHNLAASYLLLGLDGTTTVTLNRGTGTQGTLSLGNLYLGNGQNLTLIFGDTVNGGGTDSASVETGATLTTASKFNITNAVNVETGGTMNLGAGLSVSGNVNVQDTGSTFNAQGQPVSAAELLFGSNGTASVTVSDLGAVTAGELFVGNATSVTLHGGDVISSAIDLAASSVLAVDQSSTGTGLTLNGTSSTDLKIDPSSMDLIYASLTPPTNANWDFRWKDPNHTNNWISTLTTMIGDHQIDLTLPPGETYEVLDSSGYTYIDAVPEPAPLPSSLALAGLGFAGLLAARVIKRRADAGSRLA